MHDGTSTLRTAAPPAERAAALPTALARRPALAGRTSERWLDAGRRAALADAARALLVTRLLVLAAGVVAHVTVAERPGARAAFDPERLTVPFGVLGDALVAPAARWDAVWYLTIAERGYELDAVRPAFFPLYPLLAQGAGAVVASTLLGGILVSLLAFGVALYLLRRLTALELGPEAARAAVWLTAAFPAALFFSAVYSEALFLALSVGCVYAARTDRWAWAGVLGLLATSTRSAGIILLVPLAVLLWQHRGAGLWQGASAAWGGVRQLRSGSAERIFFAPAGGDPVEVARMNLQLFGFLVLALVALVGAARRLSPLYAAYVLAALALPLSTPVEAQPLMSLPRFVAVLFPLFMWGGWWLARRGRPTRAAVGVASIAGLVVFTGQFATWRWVA